MCTIPVMFSYWAKPEDGLEVAQFLNDHLAEVAAQYPRRFIGLGTLPLQDADLAIQELRRCVEELGLPGVQIGSHVNEKNLDDPELFRVFEAAESLGAAIMVHPWDMIGTQQMPKYWLPWLVGMPAETSLAICSMVFGGVLEQLPKLRVMFSHGGGSFPATLARIEHGFNVRPDLVAVDNPVNPRKYIGKFFIDSIVHDPQTLLFITEVMGEDTIMLGSDYPFPLGELEPGKMISEMDGLSVATKHKFFSDNALHWLDLDPEPFWEEKRKHYGKSASQV
jgi:aminocarboxymuconate-semialdehyde decarboxylase